MPQLYQRENMPDIGVSIERRTIFIAAWKDKPLRMIEYNNLTAFGDYLDWLDNAYGKSVVVDELPTNTDVDYVSHHVSSSDT